MPLRTAIVDIDGSQRSLRWGLWHLQMMEHAAECEGINLRDAGSYELQEWHGYIDPEDGEELDLPAGTTLRLWRD